VINFLDMDVNHILFYAGPGGIDLVERASQANRGSKILPPQTDHIVEV
jgi:hypothetical protein